MQRFFLTYSYMLICFSIYPLERFVSKQCRACVLSIFMCRGYAVWTLVSPHAPCSAVYWICHGFFFFFFVVVFSFFGTDAGLFLALIIDYDTIMCLNCSTVHLSLS